MPPAATKPPTQRKRNRKRKRRAASTSSSSLDSSSDPTEDETPKTATKLVPVPSSVSQPQPESDLASDSSSSESSSSDEEDRTAEIPRGRQNITLKTPRQFSLSPSPPSAALPSFLPSENAGNDTGSKEKDLKDRFRQFWMTSVADGFQDDLEEIHKVIVFAYIIYIYLWSLTCHNSRNLTLEPRV